MARKRLVIPVFETEAAEADWWYRHRREVEADFRQRMREGTTLTLAQVLARAKKKKKERVVATKNHYYVEQTEDGRYAVRGERSERALGVFDTQREAIGHAKQLNPDDHPDVERVRNTESGSRDKWRSSRS